jgi:hypothetical protein
MATKSSTARRPVDLLLTCGVVAGPLYAGIAALEYLFRDGLDIRHHVLSLAENGSLGWLQSANFVITGGLTMAAAVGLRQALRPGRGSTWGPRLIGVYGAGLVAAGLFRADPAEGFPPGTPTGPPGSVSWHGLVHLACASLAFLALIVACFVLARRFGAAGLRGWRTYSIVTAVLLLLAQIALSAAPGPVVNVVYVVVALHASIWVTAVSALLRKNAHAVQVDSGERSQTT